VLADFRAKAADAAGDERDALIHCLPLSHLSCSAQRGAAQQARDGREGVTNLSNARARAAAAQAFGSLPPGPLAEFAAALRKPSCTDFHKSRLRSVNPLSMDQGVWPRMLLSWLRNFCCWSRKICRLFSR